MQEQITRTESDARPTLPPYDWRLLSTVVVTGVLAYATVMLTTPVPVQEHSESYPLLGLFLETAWVGSLFVGAYMMVQRQFRWGYAAFAAASWVWLAGVIACPATGHHDFGAWWAGQMAVGLVWVAVATVASAINLRAQEPELQSQQ